MATYKQIQDWVRLNHGFVPNTCWIAHVKLMCGIRVRKAPNRRGNERLFPCPPEKVEIIRAALKHFDMI